MVGKLKIIDEITSIYQSETISNSSFDYGAKYKVYGAGGYIGNYSEYNHEYGEVILSCRGSCDKVYFTMPKSWITGNAMVVTPKNKKYYCKEYLFQTFNYFGFEKYVTGSVQKQLTRTNLSKMQIIVPPKALLGEFEDKLGAMRKNIQLKIEENDTLIEFRDQILPLLINGQIEINKATQL